MFLDSLNGGTRQDEDEEEVTEKSQNQNQINQSTPSDPSMVLEPH